MLLLENALLKQSAFTPKWEDEPLLPTKMTLAIFKTKIDIIIFYNLIESIAQLLLPCMW